MSYDTTTTTPPTGTTTPPTGTTTTPPTGRNKYRPFRARIAHGQVQIRMLLSARAHGCTGLSDALPDMSWQMSLPHARLLYGALGAALEEAAAAGLASDDNRHPANTT
jgi:hypothetical protein